MPSICWTFMQLQADKRTAICTICNLQLCYSHRSTTNMMRHLKALHPLELQTEIDRQQARATDVKGSPSTSGASFFPETTLSAANVQPTLTQAFQLASKYKPDSMRKRYLDECILNLIIMDIQPLSIVEDRGFRQLINSLDQRYEIVSRKHLSYQLLPARYASEKEALVEMLKSVEHLSLTTDCWTSRANEAFTTVTCHFIDQEWKMKTPVLMTHSEGQCHTSENLAEELKLTIAEFGIEGKVRNIVTDNVRNVTNAIDATNARHLPCFAHSLNLVMKQGLEEVEEVKAIVKKIKDIVTFFNSNIVAANKLREIHAEIGSEARKLKQDVDTYWNSTYDMLNSYLNQHGAVTTALSHIGRISLIFEDDDVPAAKAIMQTLQPFYEATVELSTEKLSPASKILPMIRILMRFTAGKDVSPLARRLNNLLHARFGFWEERSTNLKLATLLDPRFRKSGFTTQEAARNAEEKLKEVARRIPVSHNQTEMEELLLSSPQPKETSFLWSDFDEEVSKTQMTTVCHYMTAAEIEVCHYFESMGLSREKNPLIWWKEHAHLFPRLALIAKEVLAIPATSVPSERIFSKAGELISARRSRLTKKNVDMIIFLNKNV